MRTNGIIHKLVIICFFTMLAGMVYHYGPECENYVIDYVSESEFYFDSNGCNFCENGYVVITAEMAQSCVPTEFEYEWVGLNYIPDDFSNDLYQVWCDENTSTEPREAYLYLTPSDVLYIFQEGACEPAATPGAISGSTTVCSGTSYNYSIASVPDATGYDWVVPYGWTLNSVTGDTAINVTPGGSGTEYIQVWAYNDCGYSEVESYLEVSVSASVSITQHPASQQKCPGTNVTFSVSATPSGVTYQWQKNEVNIQGATSSQYTIQNLTSADAGSYRVVVTGTCNNATSQSATLTVNEAVSITTQPQGKTVVPGSQAQFSVVAAGTGLSYQWQKNQVDIPGATSSTYTINATESGHQGSYRVIVTGTCGSLTSQAAVLTLYSDNLELTDTVAYMMVSEPLKMIHADSACGVLSPGDLRHQVQYFDGAGRASQTIMVGASPSGNDVVQHHSYDYRGREAVKYLPFTVQSGNGSLVSDAVTAQASFYNTLYTGEGSYAKSVTTYEESHLGRITSQFSPGSAWQTQNQEKGVRYDYYSNKAEEVIRFVTDGDEVTRDGFYPEGSLGKVTITDSNHDAISSTLLHSRVEFYDHRQKLILSRTWVEGSSGVDTLDTYYVYDIRGRLRYVFTPEAVSRLGSVTVFTPDSSLVRNLCYFYKYDTRDRMTEKQLPGASPVYMVYDRRDRLVLSQDGNLRDQGARKWMFTKYDIQNRPVLSGILTHSTISSLAAMQEEVDDFYSGQTPGDLWVTRNGQDTTHHGYTNTSFPSTVDGTLEYLSASYYDSYGFPGARSFNTTWDISDGDFVAGTGSYNPHTGTLVTGSRVRILGSGSFVTTTYYYDDYYRVIQTLRDLHDGNPSQDSYEIASVKFDFPGRVLQQRQRQVFGTETNMTDMFFSYDHAGRVDTVHHKVDGRSGGPVVLSVLKYNELGQVETKGLHHTQAGFMQEIDYRYNIRGWLTGINDPGNLGSDLFAMSLFYNDVSSLSALDSAMAQYNGNIAGVIWNGRVGANPADTLLRAYSYTYDATGRITGSYYGQQSQGVLTASQKLREYDYMYDLNGNIQGMKRTGNTGSLIDDLIYDYGQSSLYSNRLLKVTDGSHTDAGFKDGTNQNDDYEYDSNGNLIKDLNKGISSITYNFLNLPELITTAQGTIRFYYDATGRKVGKVVLKEQIQQQGHTKGDSSMKMVFWQ